MEPVVLVAIINWNTRDLLKDCLRSVYDDPPACQFEVLVIDNASTDGSVELVRGDFPQAGLMVNESNLGFARAANQAVLGAQAPYIFLLNGDTRVFPGAIDSLLAFAESHAETGAVGPRLVNSDGSLQLSCRRFPGLATGIGHAILSLISADNPYTKRYQLTDWDHASAVEVDWVSGAAVFLRRGAVCEVGLFDEAYFMYVEDLDLCYRLWQAGHKVYYQPQAQVLHHVGQSSSLRTPQMIMEHHKSLYHFIAKYSTGYRRLLNLPLGAGLLLRGWLAAGLSVLKGGPSGSH